MSIVDDTAVAPESTIVDTRPKGYTEAEARRETDEAKMDMEALWRRLRDLHDHRAWVALGYKSWKLYCFAEFNISKSRAYQLVKAARVEEQIHNADDEKRWGTRNAATPDPTLTFNEAQLRELGNDPHPQNAWSAAVKRFGSQPTAAQIKEVVDERQASRTPGRSPKPPKPRKVGSLTLSLARFSMAADGRSTCRASASLVDKQGEPFGGQRVVFGALERANGYGGRRESSKVQISHVKEHSDGVYSVVLTAGKEPGDLVIRAHVETEDGGHLRGSNSHSSPTLSLTAPKRGGVRAVVLFKALEPGEVELLTSREFESLDDLRGELGASR